CVASRELIPDAAGLFDIVQWLGLLCGNEYCRFQYDDHVAHRPQSRWRLDHGSLVRVHRERREFLRAHLSGCDARSIESNADAPRSLERYTEKSPRLRLAIYLGWSGNRAAAFGNVVCAE